MEALFKAIRKGDLEAIKEGLRSINDIDAFGPEEQTLLTYSAKHGSMAIVDLLLEKGASVSVINGSGKLPEEVALEAGRASLYARMRTAKEVDFKNGSRKSILLLNEEERLLLKVFNDQLIIGDGVASLAAIIESEDPENSSIKALLASGNFSEKMTELVFRNLGKTTRRGTKEYSRQLKVAAEIQVNHDLLCSIPIDLDNRVRYPGYNEEYLGRLASHLAQRDELKRDARFIARYVFNYRDIVLLNEELFEVAIQQASEATRSNVAVSLVRDSCLRNEDHLKTMDRLGFLDGFSRVGFIPLDSLLETSDPQVQQALNKVFDPNLAFSTYSWAKEPLFSRFFRSGKSCIFQKLIDAGADVPSEQVLTESIARLIREPVGTDINALRIAMVWLIEHGASKSLKIELEGELLGPFEAIAKLTRVRNTHESLQFALAEILLDHGFDVGSWDSIIGLSSRSRAQSIGLVPLEQSYFDLLKKAPQGLDSRDSQGNTSLMLAAQSINYHTAMRLLVQGANPHLVNAKGKNALSLLAKKSTSNSDDADTKSELVTLLVGEMSPEDADDRMENFVKRLRFIATLRTGNTVRLVSIHGEEVEAQVSKIWNGKIEFENGGRMSISEIHGCGPKGNFELVPEGMRPMYYDIKKSSELKM